MHPPLPTCFKREMTIRVGTDCSGIDAPLQALKNLGVPFHHVFSSDIDATCRATIEANASPDILYGRDTADGDITRRDNAQTPEVDLYVCGFPCQPFSKVGMKRGLEDARGTVFFGCADYIRTKRPKFFVLENVKQLLSNDNGHTWAVVHGTLMDIPGYAVSWSILNTRDHGVPQSRNGSTLWAFATRRRPLHSQLRACPPPRPSSTTQTPPWTARQPDGRCDARGAPSWRGAPVCRHPAVPHTAARPQRGLTWPPVCSPRVTCGASLCSDGPIALSS